MIGRLRSILFVSFYQDSLAVAIVMIVGSEKTEVHNTKSLQYILCDVFRVKSVFRTNFAREK